MCVCGNVGLYVYVEVRVRGGGGGGGGVCVCVCLCVCEVCTVSTSPTSHHINHTHIHTHMHTRALTHSLTHSLTSSSPSLLLQSGACSSVCVVFVVCSCHPHTLTHSHTHILWVSGVLGAAESGGTLVSLAPAAPAAPRHRVGGHLGCSTVPVALFFSC